MRNGGKVTADADIDGLAVLHGGGDGGVEELVSVFEIVHHRLLRPP